MECTFHILPGNEIKYVPSEGGIPAIPLPVADLCYSGQVYIHATHSSLLLVKLISIHPEICEIEFVEGSILATLYFQGQRVFPGI